ncbi:hypothetical protein F2P81_019573 [Scophthalmus maximus]|uniref:Uncharacterized protein n=1 Tax=Scophthalmus maximus TaxID=52904 RepID=A0A6A4RZW9_SCOMX|nr:hypothetical protein F2P81_019573 [Scophthalmus maximus]
MWKNNDRGKSISILIDFDHIGLITSSSLGHDDSSQKNIIRRGKMKLSTKDLMQKLANIYIIQGSMLSYDHINGNYIILIQEFGQGLVRDIQIGIMAHGQGHITDVKTYALISAWERMFCIPHKHAPFRIRSPTDSRRLCFQVEEAL